MKHTQPSQLKNILIVGLLTGVVLLIAIWTYIAAAAYNFFVIADNLLHSFGSQSPGLMWALGGLMFGAATGGIVATWKYRLKKQWGLGSIAPLLLFLLISLLMRAPLSTVVPQPEVAEKKATTDTQTVVTMPVVKKRHRLHNIHNATDTTAHHLSTTALHPVNLLVNEDSLTLYYQVAPAIEGPWPEQWAHKFIPQGGEYNLTDEQDQMIRAGSVRFFFVRAGENVPESPKIQTSSAGKRKSILVKSE